MGYSYKTVSVDKIYIGLDIFHDRLKDISYHVICMHCKIFRRFTVNTWRLAASSFTIIFTGVYLYNKFRNQDMVGLC